MTEAAEVQTEEVTEESNLAGTGGTFDVTDTKPLEDREPESIEDIKKDGLIFGKYKTELDLAKAYKESDKKVKELMRQQKEGIAPDEYKFDFSADEDLKDIDLAESPILDKMLPAFKDAGFTQDQASTIVAEYLKMEKAQAEEWQKEAEEARKTEMAKLGSDGKRAIERIQTLAQKTLSEEEQTVLADLATTADAVHVLNKIMGISPNESIAVSANAAPKASAEELKMKADAFLKEHKRTMSYDKAKQDEYMRLRREQLDAGRAS